MLVVPRNPSRLRVSALVSAVVLLAAGAAAAIAAGLPGSDLLCASGGAVAAVCHANVAQYARRRR